MSPLPNADLAEYLKIIGVVVGVFTALFAAFLSFISAVGSLLYLGVKLGRLDKKIDDSITYLAQNQRDLRKIFFKREGGLAFVKTDDCESSRNKCQDNVCNKVEQIRRELNIHDDVGNKRWAITSEHMTRVSEKNKISNEVVDLIKDHLQKRRAEDV